MSTACDCRAPGIAHAVTCPAFRRAATTSEVERLIAEFEQAVREDEREGGTDSSESCVRVKWRALRDVLRQGGV